MTPVQQLKRDIDRAWALPHDRLLSVSRRLLERLEAARLLLRVHGLISDRENVRIRQRNKRLADRLGFDLR